MSEKRSLLITSITENPYTKNGETKIYYNFMVDGVQYSTTDAQIKQYVNKLHEFDVNESNGKFYVNFPKAGAGKPWSGGGKAPYVAGFNQTKEGAILGAKTMTLSYCCEHLVGNMIASAQLKREDVAKEVIKLYNEILPVLALDQIKDAPIQAPSAPQAPSYKLRDPLLIMLKAKTRGWTNIDIVSFGTSLDISIPHDPINGDVFLEKISEADAQKLLNGLAQE